MSIADRPAVDVSSYRSDFGAGHRLRRCAWDVARALLFRLSPRPCFAWRRGLLRLFGAKLGRKVHVYPDTRIWAPWNLEMGDYACLGPRVDCYCVDRIFVGPHATVSQYAHLCAAGHDIRDPRMRLITAPIRIGAGAWICAGAFVNMGVTVGDGGVVGAHAVALRDVAPWTVVAGNPARVVKRRELERGAP
jgi:putative colanic acid biosynthesis acetyltransferase WcaF